MWRDGQVYTNKIRSQKIRNRVHCNPWSLADWPLLPRFLLEEDPEDKAYCQWSRRMRVCGDALSVNEGVRKPAMDGWTRGRNHGSRAMRVLTHWKLHTAGGGLLLGCPLSSSPCRVFPGCPSFAMSCLVPLAEVCNTHKQYCTMTYEKNNLCLQNNTNTWRTDTWGARSLKLHLSLILAWAHFGTNHPGTRLVNPSQGRLGFSSSAFHVSVFPKWKEGLAWDQQEAYAWQLSCKKKNGQTLKLFDKPQNRKSETVEMYDSISTKKMKQMTDWWRLLCFGQFFL